MIVSQDKPLSFDDYEATIERFKRAFIHRDIFDKERENGEFSEWLHCVESNLDSFANWLTVPQALNEAIKANASQLTDESKLALAKRSVDDEEENQKGED